MTFKAFSPGLRAVRVDANSASEAPDTAAKIFAQRLARRQFGKRAYVGNLSLAGWRNGDQSWKAYRAIICAPPDKSGWSRFVTERIEVSVSASPADL